MVVVTEKALRDLVREVLDNRELAGWSSNDEGPITVNPNVDPSAAVTDPVNPDFTPQTKTEFGVALSQLVKNLPDTQMPGLYDTVKAAIDDQTRKEDEEAMDKKAAQGGTEQVEESIRRVVRQILAKNAATLTEAPVDPADVQADQDPDEPEDAEGRPKRRHSYKSSAIGGMSDVGGASFEEIAKSLGFSVAGAKQAVDKALEKARFLATGMDEDDREILILTAMNDYIKMLTKSGELTGADVQLMKDHPGIVRELDGFREFLHNSIRKARKGAALENPLGESVESNKALGFKGWQAQVANVCLELVGDDPEIHQVAARVDYDRGVDPETYARELLADMGYENLDEAEGTSDKSGAADQKPASTKPNVTKAKSGFHKGRDIQIDWGGFNESEETSALHGLPEGRVLDLKKIDRFLKESAKKS